MRHDHYAPHFSCNFEGYYTRVQLADGGTVAIIFSWVKHAKNRKNLVLVAYVPCAPSSHGVERTADDLVEAGLRGPSPSTSNKLSFPTSETSSLPAGGFKYEFYPERFDISVPKPPPMLTRGREPAPFTITAPGIGSMHVTPTTIEYALAVPEHGLHVHLTLDAHTPWSRARAQPLRGPMGTLLHLSLLLPLNWHVRSTGSRAAYALTHAGVSVQGTGRAHAEKNWGGSFPRGWVWAQGFSDAFATAELGDTKERTFCIAGGAALPGVRAYLAGYRSPACEWDFRPPYTLGMGPFSPFLRVKKDCERGELQIKLRTWLKRLDVKIEAPPRGFVGMAAPLRDGHELDFAHESFHALLSIKACRRRWPWAKWDLVEECVLGQTTDGMSCGALEFGGAFFHREKA